MSARSTKDMKNGKKQGIKRKPIGQNTVQAALWYTSCKLKEILIRIIHKIKIFV